MTGLLLKRLTIVWIALVLATIVSFEMPGGGGTAEQTRLAAVFILVIAFVKTRYIMLEFMEIRHAPLPLRLAAEAWVLVVCVAVVGTYLLGSG